MNIGIIGATGFLGNYIIKYLSKMKKYNLYGLSRSSKLRKTNNIKWIVGDLSSKYTCNDLIEKSDIILHLAHTNTPINSNSDFYKDTSLNLMPNLTFIESIRNSKKKIHIVYASTSGAIYDHTNQAKKYNETSLPNPSSSYGIQKLAMEHYLKLACKDSELTTNVLRISNPYGVLLPKERKQGLIGVALNKIILKQKVQIFGNPNNIRDYIHLYDVINAFKKALVPRKDFDLFNIASGETYSVNEVLNLIKQISNINFDIEYIDIDDSKNLVKFVNLDISYAKNYLDWSPTYALKDGLAEMWKKYSK